LSAAAASSRAAAIQDYGMMARGFAGQRGNAAMQATAAASAGVSNPFTLAAHRGRVRAHKFLKSGAGLAKVLVLLAFNLGRHRGPKLGSIGRVHSTFLIQGEAAMSRSIQGDRRAAIAPIRRIAGGLALRPVALALASTVALTIGGTASAEQPPAQGYDHYVGHYGTKNVKPSFLTGAISAKYYPAGACTPVGTWCGDAGDDLLTGGLGKTGLAAAAPAFANPLAPTPTELRRNAIHTNYRAVLDILAAGGYGTLYGPNVTNDFVVTASEGKIPGWEYIAYADDGSGRRNVTLMAQVPDSFDPGRPCIVTATSSGSRGVYGAIGASGEWGLKQGCAVAYTDKGTGNGLHDLMTDSVGLIDGTRTDAATAGDASIFTADASAAERVAFNAATPNRVAYKHAHSEQNPERNWGNNTLQAVRLAFWALNEKFGSVGPDGAVRVAFDPKNTLVIASGISNGGTGALQAAEQDLSGLIDGVAITEPNAQPGNLKGLRIVQGSVEQPAIGKPLLDYFTYANLYQPCAAATMAPADSAGYLFVSILTPTVISQGATRCASLAAKGLVDGTTLADQSADARARLRAYGWLADSDALQLSHYAFATPAIAVTYTNALGRASVLDNLCGYSFANTSGAGDPIAQVPALQLGNFSTGNGVPPTPGVNLVYNLAANGAGAGKRDLFASSPSNGALDLALDGAVCQRNVTVGTDIVGGGALAGDEAAIAASIGRGVTEVLLNARLRGKPTLIVHGRSDALVPVNHASRAYYGANQLAEGGGHRDVSYVEVTNAQHFDAFLGFPGYADRYVPLHVYLIRALNSMWAHLTGGAALPPSQVVRGVPRGPGAPPITWTNVPDFQANPGAGERITFGGSTLYIPD
jgi:hydroxybutyrate-dimer hydrolase